MLLSNQILDSTLEYLKGVGPVRASLLEKELEIKTIGDYLAAFPFRYEDRSVIMHIKDVVSKDMAVQVQGTLMNVQVITGRNNRKRLTAVLKDSTGFMELVWFKGIKWVSKLLVEGEQYVAYGRVNIFKGSKSIPHPDLETLAEYQAKPGKEFAPVYSSTEKLNNSGLDNKARRKIAKTILEKISQKDIPEVLPTYIVEKFRLPSRYHAIFQLHLPSSMNEVNLAQQRIKFEELFFFQIRLMQSKAWRKITLKGYVFEKIGHYFNTFYSEKLPFELTGAQKRVVREIRKDLGSGHHMNRLLQGDVGSGKTIVALLSMLIALDNGFQSSMMAPTEILAQQHYQSILNYTKGLGLRIAYLSGSVKGKKRKELLRLLAEGDIHILIGTHALIEDPVVFKNLGLAITDEQHRFGVKQRSKLWNKSSPYPPHVLVMTATPIPRTLAMTLYGDLDISVIDELPPGRKEIKTIHKSENFKGKVMEFMKQEIVKGRQVYVVFPLIEESETLDLQNLQQGYERLLEYFPLPKYQISVVHGRMKTEEKDYEMQRFVEGKTNIMVATTVIEVGVNVPNASVMVIENAERFGLSQLHQLRGRVGRGAEQSYCILSTGFKLSKEGRQRIETMVQTNDGFKISEADLALRGPGSIDGTQQSGITEMALVDLAKDSKILVTARYVAEQIIDQDPELKHPENYPMALHLKKLDKIKRTWGKIS